MEINRSKSEKKIIKFWQENRIFEKSLEGKNKNFVFYEGPPTANGKPGVHHILARAFKDAICRYKTMQGFRVLRKAGWDVHGLPVEISVEKELGIHDKKEIEEYGIAKFNEKCKKSVWRYAQEWTELTERIGYWLDLKNPYITSNPYYMESLFSIIKQLWNRGLLEEDYKVVPYCPRCGTCLSSHELAQGYRKVKENAVYIKFELKDNIFNVKASTYLLVWTTTPWTLPANVAIAVNPKITYILVKTEKDYLILAKDRKNILAEDKEFKVVKEFKGKKIVGLFYNPLFGKDVLSLNKDDIEGKNNKGLYQILPADFVTTEEGSGLVHIAPAFGQDDMELIKKENSKRKKKEERFPILITVDKEGKFKPEVKKWAGIFVKKADPLIISYLQSAGALFREEKLEHDYPFCWRCQTPLLYYAEKSWFIKTKKVKEELIKNNQTINWIPGHIKNGRFGEWLNDLKDWALSRERYWGTPLPIWKCKECGHIEVIGSRKEIKKQKFSTNKYFFLRHGEAISNTQKFYSSWPEARPVLLTKVGQKEIKDQLSELKNKKIDLVFASDFSRTKETAEIVAKELGLKIIFDKRLREIDTGELNGQPITKERSFIDNDDQREEQLLEKLKKKFPGGENCLGVRARALSFLEEINKKYKNKNILIVSHQVVIAMIDASMSGLTNLETVRNSKKLAPKTGELRKLDYKFFPYDKEGEIDFHRPYIDKLKFSCPKCGQPMERIPEVADCWFDSGSMPFAQAHWPFEQNNKLATEKKILAPPELFPADYIAEAIDQTRGWFYTLLAVSTLLGFVSPYKNVIALGHVLDSKGQKMSKSKGNVVDPWNMLEKYGADSLRWYFYTVNQPGDSKLFVEKDIDKTLKKFIMTLWNCYVFYNTYGQSKPDKDQKLKQDKPKNILDRWILSRLNRLTQEVEQKLDDYDITGAGRATEGFVINDLSLWYIRRSRLRFQSPDNQEDKEQASVVLRNLLLNVAKITAPFIPFISEEIYQGIKEKQEELSIHLHSWPKANKELIDKKLEQEMAIIKKIVAMGLKIRSEQQIKVRQPLATLEIKSKKITLNKELFKLIREEINVKEIRIVDDISQGADWAREENEGLEVALNTKITPQLRDEGTIREIVRQIQQMRKKAGCKPENIIVIYGQGDKDLSELLLKKKESFLSQIRAKDFIFQRKENDVFTIEKEVKVQDKNFWLGLKIVVK